MTSPYAATAETGKAELEQLLDAFADRYKIVHFDYPQDSLESQGWEVVILEDRTHFIPWAEHVATVQAFLDELDW